MRCNNCGMENVSGAAFCSRCGALLAEPMYSPEQQEQTYYEPQYQAQNPNPNWGVQPNQGMRPAPRKNNLPIVVGLSVALVLAIGVGAFALISSRPSANAGNKPEQSSSNIMLIAQNFIGTLYNNNYSKVKPQQIMSYAPIVQRCIPHMRPGSAACNKFVTQVKKVFVDNSKNNYTRVINNKNIVVKPGTGNNPPVIVVPWKVAFVVSFDANGGTGSINSITVLQNQSETLPANGFEREGYVFRSWNTSPDGSGQTYTAGSKITPSENMALYAQWDKDTENPDPTPEPVKTYTLAFDANGGTGSAQSATVKDGETATLPADGFDREGYKLDGWNTSADGSGDAYGAGAEFAPKADTTFYAQWAKEEDKKPEPKTYTVAFDANGGTGSANEVTVNVGETATLPTGGFEREGYEFNGWNTWADGSGQGFDAGAEFKPETDTLLFAQWAEKQKDTDPEPGNPTGPTDPSTPTDPTEPSNPTDPANPKEPTTTPEPSGTTNPTDPTTPTEPSGTANPTEPTTTPEPTNPSDPSGTTNPTDPTEPTNPTTPTEPSYSTTPTEPTVTTYYIITFDTNGGSGYVQPAQVESGQSTTLPSGGLTREGYEFAGWGLSPDSGSTYYGGTELTPTSDMTLYAQWIKVEQTTTPDPSVTTGSEKSPSQEPNSTDAHQDEWTVNVDNEGMVTDVENVTDGAQPSDNAGANDFGGTETTPDATPSETKGDASGSDEENTESA